MSFQSMKKSTKEQFNLIAEKFKEATAPSNSKFPVDDRLWYPQGDDKTGNGSAVIRFLPATEDAIDGKPWVKTWVHNFKGPTGSWFSEICPTTLKDGAECPVCAANRILWNSGDPGDKKIASSRKRNLRIYSNVFIIKDPGNPENEGQVKIYRYGKHIFDMLNDQMNPSFDDVDRVNPFDLWEGANFRMRFKMEDGYRSYKASIFDSPKPLFENDEILEKIYNKMYNLNEFIAPELFKEPDVMAALLKNVTEGDGRALMATQRESEDVSLGDVPFDADTPSSSEEILVEKTPNTTAINVSSLHGSDDEEFEDFFKELNDMKE